MENKKNVDLSMNKNQANPRQRSGVFLPEPTSS